MRSVYHIMAMVCIIVTLTVVGLAIWLSAAGRLSVANRDVIGRMIRGRELFDPSASETTTQPATTRQALPAAARTDLEMSEKAIERTELLTSRSRAELDHQRRQLETLGKQIEAERAALANERIAFAEEIEAARRSKDDAGFKRELELYEMMAPKQAKDVLSDLPEDLAAKYMAAMGAQAVADIVGKFRSPAEKIKLQRLLDLMREV